MTPQLIDERHMMLRLRCFEHADRDLIVSYLNELNVTRLLSSRIPQPYSKNDADWWIETGSQSGVIRAIEKDGEFVGCIGAEPGQFEFERTAEVGYWLSQQFWGKGIATEALQLLIAEVKKDSKITRLQATVFEGNTASGKVLKNCGFIQQGCLPSAIYKNERFYDALIFGRAV